MGRLRGKNDGAGGADSVPVRMAVDAYVFNALLNDGRPVKHVTPYRAPTEGSLPAPDPDRCATMHDHTVVEDALLYATFGWSNLRSGGAGTGARRGGGYRRRPTAAAGELRGNSSNDEVRVFVRQCSSVIACKA